MKELNQIISEHIKVGKELFEADEYQVYVSAVSLSYAQKCFIATIPSGQGKTIIMLLNALYEILSSKVDSVCFVSCSEILSNQLKRDITAIVPKYASKFVFGHIEKPETIQPKAVMIVDEAD